MISLRHFFASILALATWSVSGQTISTGAISGSPFCPGTSVSVPYTATGTFSGNNNFRAQLSNASGSFATPTVIGTRAATTSGTITATIPSNAAAGTGYRIRVVSTNPAINGTDNGSNLTIYSSATCGNSWTTTGNAGTNAANNFIGTIANAPLVFRVNNIRSGVIDPNSTSTSFGYGTLSSNTTGYNNTAFGYSALYSNTVGVNNVALGTNSLFNNRGNSNIGIGYNALYSNYDGFNNVAIGQDALSSNTSGAMNTAVGVNSLLHNTNGIRNTAIGHSALISNTEGRNNTAVGIEALSSNTTGQYNTAVGGNSLNYNTTAGGNTASGFNSLHSNSTGSYNSAHGFSSLFSNTTGESNTAVGVNALYSNTTASNNTALGTNSLYSNTVGINNVAIGVSSLQNNTTGNRNVAIGYYSLYSNTEGINNIGIGEASLSLNTTGGLNTAVGINSMLRNTTGQQNTAIGFNSLWNNSEGRNNTAIGTESLRSNTTGQYNIALGNNSLYSSNATQNTALGFNSMLLNTTGSLNTASGYISLSNNTTGSNNTAISANSLLNNTTGSNNTGIGYGADVTAGNLNNATAIGAGASVNASNKVRIGSSGVTVVESAVGSWTTSDGRFKSNIKEDAPGLNLILKLKPVTYNFQYGKFSDFLKEKNANKDHLRQKESKKEMGLVAQEVEKACRDLGIEVSNLVHVPDNDNDNYSLSYGELVVPLIKGMQEQQKIIEELKKLVEQQGKQLQSVLQSGGAFISGNNAVPTVLSEANVAESLLGQNIPNPLNGVTVIPYRIPGNCKDAAIVVSNLSSGQVIKAVPLNCKETQLSLDASQLPAGTYSYALYLEGKAVITKKMVVAR